MESIRVGFVGLGGICRKRHVPGLRRIPGVTITAVANRSRASGETAAREFGIPAVCEAWQDLVARDDVDAVFIGTWPCLHRAVTLAALEAGKHVFCQARMAMNAAEARQMYDRARASDRVTALCPVPYGLSVDKTVARLLRESFVGDLRLVRVQSFSPAFADPDAPMTWRKDHRLSGRNMHTLGMYVEVVHRWFGPTRAVSAQNWTFVPERTDAAGERVAVEVPDEVLINASMDAEFPVQYVFSTTVHHGADAIEVYGTRGTLRYDVGADVLYGAQAGEAMAALAIVPEDRYDVNEWRVEQDFINAVRGGKPYHPDFADGLRYMQVIDAVYASAAAQGQAVTLE